MALSRQEPAFTQPTDIVPFGGMLFDMDGTLIDSTDAIVKYWQLLVSREPRDGRI